MLWGHYFSIGLHILPNLGAFGDPRPIRHLALYISLNYVIDVAIHFCCQ